MRIKWNYLIYHGKSEINRNSINSLDINPFKNLLVTGGQDALIKIWNTKSLSPKKKNLSNKEIYRNIIDNEDFCKIFEFHKRQVNIVRWSLNGKLLASGGDDGKLVLCSHSFNRNFNQYFLKIFFIFNNIQNDIIYINWSPDSKFISVISLNNIVTIYAIEKKYVFAQITSKIFSIKGSCWDPIGHFLITQSNSQGIKLWDILRWKLHKTIEFYTQSKINIKYPQKSFIGKPSWTPCGSFLIFFDNFSIEQNHYLKAIRWSKNFTKYKIFFQGKKQINIILESPRIYSSNLFFRTSSIMIITTEEGKIYIWAPNFSKIMLSVKNLYGKNFSDITWGFNGYCIYLSTSKGDVFCVNFKPTELGKVLKNTDHMELLRTSLLIRKSYKKVFSLPYSQSKKKINMLNHKPFFKTNIIKEILLRLLIFLKNLILSRDNLGCEIRYKRTWNFLRRNLNKVLVFKKILFFEEYLNSLIFLSKFDKDRYFISIKIEDRFFYINKKKSMVEIKFSTLRKLIYYLENNYFITMIYIKKKNFNIESISKINFKKSVIVYNKYIKQIKIRNNLIYLSTTTGVFEIIKLNSFKGITFFNPLKFINPWLKFSFKIFFKKCSGLLIYSLK